MDYFLLHWNGGLNLDLTLKGSIMYILTFIVGPSVQSVSSFVRTIVLVHYLVTLQLSAVGKWQYCSPKRQDILILKQWLFVQIIYCENFFTGLCKKVWPYISWIHKSQFMLGHTFISRPDKTCLLGSKSELGIREEEKLFLSTWIYKSRVL